MRNDMANKPEIKCVYSELVDPKKLKPKLLTRR